MRNEHLTINDVWERTSRNRAVAFVHCVCMDSNIRSGLLSTSARQVEMHLNRNDQQRIHKQTNTTVRIQRFNFPLIFSSVFRYIYLLFSRLYRFVLALFFFVSPFLLPFSAPLVVNSNKSNASQNKNKNERWTWTGGWKGGRWRARRASF